MNPEEAYSSGVRAAQQALADGVPRWMHTDVRPYGQFIDPDTGLPLFGISGPPELVATNQALVQGYNDTIAAALKAGEVTIDFRPSLLSRSEVLRALASSTLGTLSVENPVITGPRGEFVLKLKFPKPTSKKQLTWVSYSYSGNDWPKFDLFDQPQTVATARNGRVLVFKSANVVVTRDAETTQILNTYLLGEGAA